MGVGHLSGCGAVLRTAVKEVELVAWGLWGQREPADRGAAAHSHRLHPLSENAPRRCKTKPLNVCNRLRLQPLFRFEYTATHLSCRVYTVRNASVINISRQSFFACPFVWQNHVSGSHRAFSSTRASVVQASGRSDKFGGDNNRTRCRTSTRAGEWLSPLSASSHCSK